MQLLTAPTSSPHCMCVAQFNSRFAQGTGTLQLSLSHTDTQRMKPVEKFEPQDLLRYGYLSLPVQVHYNWVLLSFWIQFTPRPLPKGLFEKGCSQHRYCLFLACRLFQLAQWEISVTTLSKELDVLTCCRDLGEWMVKSPGKNPHILLTGYTDFNIPPPLRHLSPCSLLTRLDLAFLL